MSLEYESVKSYKYKTIDDALKEGSAGRVKPDAPVILVSPPRPVTRLPDTIIGRGIRGYCIPGYGDGQQIWMRDHDAEPYRVGLHENLHIDLRLYGGDARTGAEHEWYVRMLENWRCGYEG